MVGEYKDYELDPYLKKLYGSNSMNIRDKGWWLEWCSNRVKEGGWQTQDKEYLCQWLQDRELPSNKVVCNIGCIFDYKQEGYYQYLSSKFEKIIYVDISKEALDDLKRNVFVDNIKCYETEGFELSGIDSGSVDFIMSTDSLVYLDTAQILQYFSEFKRVLAPKGAYAIHHGPNKAPFGVINLETVRNQISGWSDILPFYKDDYIAGVNK